MLFFTHLYCILHPIETHFLLIYLIKNSQHFVQLCQCLVRLMFDMNPKPPAAL